MTQTVGAKRNAPFSALNHQPFDANEKNSSPLRKCISNQITPIIFFPDNSYGKMSLPGSPQGLPDPVPAAGANPRVAPSQGLGTPSAGLCFSSLTLNSC